MKTALSRNGSLAWLVLEEPDLAEDGFQDLVLFSGQIHRQILEEIPHLPTSVFLMRINSILLSLCAVTVLNTLQHFHANPHNDLMRCVQLSPSPFR